MAEPEEQHTTDAVDKVVEESPAASDKETVRLSVSLSVLAPNEGECIVWAVLVSRQRPASSNKLTPGADLVWMNRTPSKTPSILAP